MDFDASRDLFGLKRLIIDRDGASIIQCYSIELDYLPSRDICPMLITFVNSLDTARKQSECR